MNSPKVAVLRIPPVRKRTKNPCQCKRGDVDTARAYVLLAVVFGVLVYGILLVYIAVQYWGSETAIVSLAPVISFGLAVNQSVQAIFGTGIVVYAIHYFFFLALEFDKTPWRGWFMNSMWFIGVAATFLMWLFLFCVDLVPITTQPGPHGWLCATAIVCYFVKEVTGLIRRGPYINNPFMGALYFLEWFLLGTFIASLVCFEAQTCIGGAGGASAWEYLLFVHVVASVAFLWLDTVEPE